MIKTILIVTLIILAVGFIVWASDEADSRELGE